MSDKSVNKKKSTWVGAFIPLGVALAIWVENSVLVFVLGGLLFLVLVLYLAVPQVKDRLNGQFVDPESKWGKQIFLWGIFALACILIFSGIFFSIIRPHYNL